MLPSPDDPWAGLGPAEVRSTLEGLATPWWMCGGWGIDLWLGRQTRSHADTDIGCHRADVGELCGHIPDWEIFAALDGKLRPLSEGPLSEDVSSLWCRRRDHTRWGLQVMIEEADERLWYFRRDPRIVRRRSELTCRSPSGIEVLRPEIQLLYKAKDIRPHDEADFVAVLPKLDARSLTWLEDGLERMHPDHPWRDRL